MNAVAFVREYANRPFRFSSYYKYGFLYTCVDEPSVFVSVGGDSSEIYRASLDAEMTLANLLNEVGIEFAVAFTGDGNNIDLSGAYRDAGVWGVIREHVP